MDALGISIIEGIARARPGSRVTVFDNGWGLRPAASDQGLPSGVEVEFCGIRRSRRIHRPESWANVQLSLRLGGLGNPAATRLREATAVLDISAGDSFSDIYGPVVFDTVLRPKQVALRLGRPLVLLPQTYGPFRSGDARHRAEEVVRGARCAWARDENSFDELRRLLGTELDVHRHRAGVDLAFGLDPIEPAELPRRVRGILASDEPVAGVNVSGLLADTQPERLTVDYLQLMTGLVQLLAAQGVHVLLIPHVRDPTGVESDAAGIETVRSRVPAELAHLVVPVPDSMSAAEVKWLISRTDWFTGARMHATIAALSTGTPVAALAYSPKFAGVFATAGLPDGVVDARSGSTAEALGALKDSFDRREETARTLTDSIPAVVQRARDQMGVILEAALDGRAD